MPFVRSLGSTSEQGPRRPLRSGHEVHLQLKHIPQGVLATDTHRVLGCVHALAYGWVGPSVLDQWYLAEACPGG